LFECTKPLFPALSSAETYWRTAGSRTALSSDAEAAASTFLASVFRRLLICRLRRVRFSVLRTYLSADFVFAMVKMKTWKTENPRRTCQEGKSGVDPGAL